MKTRNLTQSSLRNDPINCPIHSFSFRNFEDEDGIQGVISPHSFNQFSISSTRQTQKRVKKRKKSVDSRIVVSTQFDFTKKSKGVFSVAKNIGFIGEKRRNRWMRWFTAMNGQDCASFDESMRLSRIYSIDCEGLRCVHVA